MGHLRDQAGRLAGLIMITLVSVLALSVPADARPSTQAMTCTQLQSFVAQQGAVTMSTTARHIYRKFYDPDRWCPFDTEHKAYTVPARDGPCRLYICRRPLEPMFDHPLFD